MTGVQTCALPISSHVRDYSLEEWRAFVTAAGLRVEEVRVLPHEVDFAAWLARTGCEGDEAERVRELWGERVAGGRLTLDKLAIRAPKA